MSAPIKSILFVCMGNICRSPAGECVMRDLLKQEGLASDVTCDSAGTIGFHKGNPPDQRMRDEGQRRGIPVEGGARQVTPEDLKKFDLVLAMDNDNYNDLVALAKDSGCEEARIEKFCSYCKKYDDSYVPDPYYGGRSGFSHVFNLLEDGCENILSEIKNAKG